MENQNERIRRLRKEKKLTQAALAKRVGVSRVMVTKWEGDASIEIGGLNLLKLSEGLGTTSDYILFGEKEIGGIKRTANESEWSQALQPNRIDLRMMLDAIIHQLDYLYKAKRLSADPVDTAKACVAKYVEYQSRKAAAETINSVLKMGPKPDSNEFTDHIKDDD